VDVDGVISLFGFQPEQPPPGRYHWINGVLHFISTAAGECLTRLAGRYDLIWATGWEETANDYLPHLLGLPGELPFLSFSTAPRFGTAHWKIDSIERYAGTERPLAWIDDSLEERCYAWAKARPGPTLLVSTICDEGICDQHVDELLAWAETLSR
jgi:hypothetical protein